jgi:pre-rRNA-processing protein TSR4
LNPFIKDPEDLEKTEKFEELKSTPSISSEAFEASDDWNTEVDSDKLLNLLSSNPEPKDSKPLIDLSLEIFEEDKKITEVINELFTLDVKNEGLVNEFYENMEGGVESAGEEKICNSQEDDDEDIGEDEMENENKSTRDVAFDTLRWFSNFHLKSPVVRYCRGGRPLWYSDKERPLIVIEKCPCGVQRTFECQVLPQMASVIKDENVEFGSIYVYTCPNSCSVQGNCFEQAFYQPSL